MIEARKSGCSGVLGRLRGLGPLVGLVLVVGVGGCDTTAQGPRRVQPDSFTPRPQTSAEAARVAEGIAQSIAAAGQLTAPNAPRRAVISVMPIRNHTAAKATAFSDFARQWQTLLQAEGDRFGLLFSRVTSDSARSGLVLHSLVLPGPADDPDTCLMQLALIGPKSDGTTTRLWEDQVLLPAP
jgi:hypothetical protein